MLNTPILTNKGTKKRKSSLKKRTQADKSEYNSGSSASMKSSQDKKKVRFDNNSIKYKYDVDGIIDTSEYKINEAESTHQKSKKPMHNECKAPAKSPTKSVSNISKIKRREQTFAYKPTKKRSNERQNLYSKFEKAKYGL